MTSTGERPTLLEEDRDHARDVVLTWVGSLWPDSRLASADQLGLMGMVTAALADARARERTRLADEPQGHPVDVEAVMDVSRLTWPEAEEQATRALRRRWVDEMTRQGLRPTTWPAVQRTAWGWRSALDVLQQLDLDDPAVEFYRLTIRGDAVPVAPGEDTTP